MIQNLGDRRRHDCRELRRQWQDGTNVQTMIIRKGAAWRLSRSACGIRAARSVTRIECVSQGSLALHREGHLHAEGRGSHGGSTR